MLQIRHLTVTHKKDLRAIVDDFSFVLGRGDRAALIGEEGNGKSTLLKLIADPALVDGYAEYEGAIDRQLLRPGYLAQELPEQEQAQTVRDFCAASPAFALLSPAELAAVGAQLGLVSAFFGAGRAVGTLSGGEKVKLQLARLLMERPDFLLLDEPSNDLDLGALAWLERFINTCGVPVLFVSHDETLLERTANVIIHLEQLRRKTAARCTVARMPYRQYVAQRAAGFAHQEQVARGEQSEYEKQQEKFRRIQSKVEHQQAAISRADPHGGRLLKKKMKAVKSQERRFEKAHEHQTELPEAEAAILMRFAPGIAVPAGKTVLDFAQEELTAGGRTLARSVRLHVEGPEKLCIVGDNGAGKSTLLKQIASLLLARTDIKAGYMPQHYADCLDGARTPVDFLSAVGDKAEITRIRTFLGSVKYTPDEMEHPVSALSGGQKAKLLLLKLIFDGCNVLVLDEPTRNFSPLSGPVVRGVLRAFGGTILSVSHDRKYLDEVCTRVLRLTPDGLLPYSGSVSDQTR